MPVTDEEADLAARLRAFADEDRIATVRVLRTLDPRILGVAYKGHPDRAESRPAITWGGAP